MITNLEEKLSGEIPVTKEDLIELVKTEFTIEIRKEIKK